MNKGFVNIITVLAALLALGGCSTISVQQLSDKYDNPIMSAAEARSTIRVEVRALEPVSADETVAAMN